MTTKQSLHESTGVVIEKDTNSPILYITVKNSSRATVDSFVASIKNEQKDWPSDRIGYYLYDFSACPNGFSTPYGKEKTKEIVAWRPELRSYAAIVVPNNVFLQLFRIFLNNVQRKGSKNYLCFSREEGLKWLKNEIAKNNPND